VTFKLNSVEGMNGCAVKLHDRQGNREVGMQARRLKYTKETTVFCVCKEISV